MAYDFGNNWHDGHQAKPYVYEPKWEKGVDYNPDHQPSSSERFSRIVDKNGEHSYFLFLHCKGLGVITIRLRPDPADPRGRLTVDSGAILDQSEIGYSPAL
jgi:hypothetical protein